MFIETVVKVTVGDHTLFAPVDNGKIDAKRVEAWLDDVVRSDATDETKKAVIEELTALNKKAE